LIYYSWLGGFILAFGNIPQILQILRTKSAVDLNLKTYILMIIGVSMMEVYAINLVVHGSGGAFLATNRYLLLH
jgi:MtN3 and saliva related transmembrane protein